MDLVSLIVALAAVLGLAGVILEIALKSPGLLAALVRDTEVFAREALPQLRASEKVLGMPANDRVRLAA